jgi:hypothetical protein
MSIAQSPDHASPDRTTTNFLDDLFLTHLSEECKDNQVQTHTARARAPAPHVRGAPRPRAHPAHPFDPAAIPFSPLPSPALTIDETAEPAFDWTMNVDRPIRVHI